MIDLAGKRFGRWTVLAIHPERVRHGRARKAVNVLWLCRCDCGTERVVFGMNLRRGLSTSCGCRTREKTRERNTRHGHACRGKVTSAYSRWVSMLQRCFNPNDKEYRHYGGRGITVCERWLDFVNFFADMGDPPRACRSIASTIDGDYGPDNCRWADAKQQRQNRRPSKQRKRRRSNLADIQAYAESFARAGARP